MAAAQQYETITMPEGGLGSFFTSNLDEVDDNVLMFGRAGGINSMKEVADRMARMGREGDNFVVHASEKEVMVPREVAENNPELVGQIKEAIAAEGADPEAYVVGSDRNSINPMTGQREFFLKKLVKGIKKVFKKAAKIIVPLAINYFLPGVGAALGTAGTAALGAGIGGLIQGESVGEALKSAATAGVLVGVGSGVFKGVQSMGEGGPGFMTGFKEGLSGSLPTTFRPGARDLLGLPAEGTPSMRLSTSNISDAGTTDPTVTPPAATTKVDELRRIGEISKETGLKPDFVSKYLGMEGAPAAAAKASTAGSFLKSALPYGLAALAAGTAGGAFDEIPAEPVDLSAYGTDVTDTSERRLEESPEKYSVGVPTSGSASAARYVRPSQTFFPASQILDASYSPSQGEYKRPIEPSRTYSALVPSGTIGGGATQTGTMVPSGGGVSTYVPPAPVVLPGYDPNVTGMRPAPLYGVDAQGNPIYTPYVEPIMPAQFVSEEPVVAAATGGPIMNRQGQRNMTMEDFPRRTGQIQGPGTEISDDIPAMLSDGEFVMTARAVRGAGNGDRQQGFRKMYDLMRAFEGGAVT